MNTEKRVQERLNNFRQAREIKLGAIEDAINEVKQNLSNREQMMIESIDNLQSDIDDVLLESRNLAEKLSTSMRGATQMFESAEEDYLFMARELDEIGVDYDNAFPDLGSDWANVYNLADEIMTDLGL